MKSDIGANYKFITQIFDMFSHFVETWFTFKKEMIG